MSSLRRHEGYYLVDNRDNPVVAEETTQKLGLPRGAGKGLFEAPTYTCPHCHRVVVMNPLRNRERAYCSGCDHYLCDGCGVVRAATGECGTLKKLFDEMQERAARSQGGIIIVGD